MRGSKEGEGELRAIRSINCRVPDSQFIDFNLQIDLFAHVLRHIFRNAEISGWAFEQLELFFRQELDPIHEVDDILRWSVYEADRV